MLYRDVLWGVPILSLSFFLFSVLFFSSSCLDLYSPFDNVNTLLETTLKWDWRGTVDPWHDLCMSCFRGWWLWTDIIQETTCFLLTNVAGLYHGVSGLFCLFPLVHPALFSGLTLESPVPPPKESYTFTLQPREESSVHSSSIFLNLYFVPGTGRGVVVSCVGFEEHTVKREGQWLSYDFYMVTLIHFCTSFQSN